jgi:hypothetical protein
MHNQSLSGDDDSRGFEVVCDTSSGSTYDNDKSGERSYR